MKIKTICKFNDNDWDSYCDDLEYEAREWCENMAEECGGEGGDFDSLMEWLNG